MNFSMAKASLVFMPETEDRASGKWMTYIVYILLICAFMNTGLRPSQDSPFSLFRIVSPFFILMIAIADFRRFGKPLLFFFGLLWWGLMSFLIFSKTTWYSMYAEYLHLLFLFGLFVLIRYLSMIDHRFHFSFYHFLDWFTVFTLLIIGWENLFETQLFDAVQIRECRPGFFWNENELGMAVGSMVPLYFFHGLAKKNIFDFIKIAIILNLLYQYDCKLTIVGLLLFVFLFIFFSPKKKWVLVFWSMGLLFIALLAAFLIAPAIDFQIKESTGTVISFHKHFFEPVKHLVTLTPFQMETGSVFGRSNAIIYGIKELFKTYLVGIGPGGSYVMLQQTQYHISNTLSMHNFLMHMTTEFGLYFILSYLFLMIYKVTKYLDKRTFILKIQAIYAFVLIPISSQASGAIFSNYMFWGIVFYIFLAQDFFYKTKNTDREQPSEPISERKVSSK